MPPMPTFFADLSETAWRLLTLQDYNTRVVLTGTIILGVASGVLGVFLLLRKRALIGDAIAHATLPGVSLAYLWTITVGGEKSLTVLLLGAACSGAVGGLLVMLLRNVVRLREDASLAIVLSVLFGGGVALLSIVQRQPGGTAAGLEAFIYGKAASMTVDDVWLGSAVALLVLFSVGLLRKELSLLCFDSDLAQSQGWPVLLLDSILIGLVVAVTIVGLQAVGLILVIALQVIPASAARFWTHNLRHMILLSAGMGAMACAVGTLLSAAFAKLPSGATIVLTASLLFGISFVLGNERGVLWRQLRLRSMRREHQELHLLRAAYEWVESTTGQRPSIDQASSPEIPLKELSRLRSWQGTSLLGTARRLARTGIIYLTEGPSGNGIRLTTKGIAKARSTVRDHRLLELYLVDRVNIPPTGVDEQADYLEHGLEPQHTEKIMREIEPSSEPPVPPSIHRLPVERPAEPPAPDSQTDKDRDHS